MNNNTNNAPANRRRDIVTPAQRNAAQEQRLAAQREASEKRLADERQAQLKNQQTAEAIRRETEARRRSSVRTPSERSASNVKAQNPTPNPRANSVPAQRGTNAAPQRNVPSHGAVQRNAPSGMTHEQQQLIQKQRQIELLERQLRAEKEQRAATAARHRRIRELELRIDHQKLLRDELIARDMRKDNQEKTKTGSIIAVAVIAILIVLNIVAFASLTKNDIPQKTTSPETDISELNGNNSPNPNDTGAAPLGGIDAERDKLTVTASDYVNGALILVNSEHPFDFNNVGIDIKDDELVTIATRIRDKTFKAANYKTYLNSETVEMLNIMMADFYAYCQKDDVMVNSAHRTFEQQQEILDSKKQQLGEDQQIAQTPGNSEHHTGYAFDFAIYPANENGSTFINIGDYTWIYENCHKYGFILRYPENKTAITGIEPESWHFRYVGVPHATYMYNKGKTLEEYMTDISVYSESIPLTITVSDTETYSVFYVPKEDAAQVTFSVPKNTEYKISGDNIGGFIVWYNNADIGNKGKITPSTDTQIPEYTDNSTSDNSTSEGSGTSDS